MSHNNFSCIQKIPVFQTLSDNIITELVKISTHKKQYESGSYIYQPDDDLSGLFIVDSGQVDIISVSSDGRELILYTLTDGQFNYDTSIFNKNKHRYFAKVRKKSQICIIRQTDFQNLLYMHPDLAIKMLNAYGDRLIEMESSFISGQFMNSSHRLMDYLTNLSERNGSETFVLNSSKKDLALILNISPATLSRLFRKLSEQKVISIANKTITIL